MTFLCVERCHRVSMKCLKTEETIMQKDRVKLSHIHKLLEQWVPTIDRSLVYEWLPNSNSNINEKFENP